VKQKVAAKEKFQENYIIKKRINIGELILN